MYESGWRPTVVVSRSSEKRLPAFGPRRTSTRPDPAGSSASSAPSSSSSSSRSSIVEMEAVVSSSLAERGAPHDEQKLAPASLSCPHRRQITRQRVLPPDWGTKRARGHGGPADACPRRYSSSTRRR